MIEERVPPQNIEAEQAVLGACTKTVATTLRKGFIERVNRFVEFMNSEDNG